uniref:Uncharacterized protein n=1 Tax=Romanomermis culicivorax TaxID=13658 RepID=A0A915L836_ROMCU
MKTIMKNSRKKKITKTMKMTT